MNSKSKTSKTAKAKASKERKGRYSTDRPKSARRADMKKDAEKAGYGRTIQNINLNANRLKNKAPEKSKEMKKDANALKKLSKGKNNTGG